MENDKLEMNDLSKMNPDLIKKIELIFKKEHIKSQNEKFQIKVLGD